MSDKIYVLTCSGGSYDDAYEYNVRAYLDKERAEADAEKLNGLMKEVKKRHDDWYASEEYKALSEEQRKLWIVVRNQLEDCKPTRKQRAPVVRVISKEEARLGEVGNLITERWKDSNKIPQEALDIDPQASDHDGYYSVQELDVACGCHCSGGCADPYAACARPCKDHMGL